MNKTRTEVIYARVKTLVKDWYEGKRKLRPLDAAAYYVFTLESFYLIKSRQEETAKVKEIADEQDEFW